VLRYEAHQIADALPNVGTSYDLPISIQIAFNPQNKNKASSSE
jgi:hypothetical protein